MGEVPALRKLTFQLHHPRSPLTCTSGEIEAQRGQACRGPSKGWWRRPRGRWDPQQSSPSSRQNFPVVRGHLGPDSNTCHPPPRRPEVSSCPWQPDGREEQGRLGGWEGDWRSCTGGSPDAFPGQGVAVGSVSMPASEIGPASEKGKTHTRTLKHPTALWLLHLKETQGLQRV